MTETDRPIYLGAGLSPQSSSLSIAPVSSTIHALVCMMRRGSWRSPVRLKIRREFYTVHRQSAITRFVFIPRSHCGTPTVAIHAEALRSLTSDLPSPPTASHAPNRCQGCIETQVDHVSRVARLTCFQVGRAPV